MSTTLPPEAQITEARPAVWEDFIDIFYSPVAVFTRRREGRFIVPLLVLSVLLAILFFSGQTVLAPMYDAEFQRAAGSALQRVPQMTTEDLARMRQMQQTFGLIGFAVSFPVMVLVLGVVVWGVGKLFNATFAIGAAMLVATYAEIPRVLEQLLGIGQGFLLDPASLDSRYSISFGAARFLDPNAVAPAVLALAGRVDLFVLWITALIAIGFHVVGRAPKSQAVLAAVLIWVLGGVVQLPGALMAGG